MTFRAQMFSLHLLSLPFAGFSQAKSTKQHSLCHTFIPIHIQLNSDSYASLPNRLLMGCVVGKVLLYDQPPLNWNLTSSSTVNLSTSMKPSDSTEIQLM